MRTGIYKLFKSEGKWERKLSWNELDEQASQINGFILREKKKHL